MKITKVGKYEIRVSGLVDSTVWILHPPGARMDEAQYVFAEEIIKMRELLYAVHKDLTPIAHLTRRLGPSEIKSIDAIAQYINNLPK